MKATGAKYRVVSTKPENGWFKTGQDADLMLSGIDFNDTGGPLAFNHPGGIAIDRERLLLADTWNNRVLIWNQLPSNGSTPPDLVLGQSSFSSNDPGHGLDRLNWPVSVASARGKVVVADANNGRILVWTSFPVRNAQPADFSIQSSGPRGLPLVWPWGAWTDGTKLAITCTHGAAGVYLWNTFPAGASQGPDVVLRNRDFGTPRTISSNGRCLMVSDHNARISPPEGRPGRSDRMGEAATFVWKNWPDANTPYDLVLDDWQSGTFLPDGGVALVGPLSPLQIWRKPPSGQGDRPDLIVGVANCGPFTQGKGYQFVTGDSSGVAFGGGRLYISMGNGNKVVVYNRIPTAATDFPDFAIGAPDIHTNTLETNYVIANPVVITNGKSLFAASDFDRKFYVWKNLPDQSGAHPDFVYTMNEIPASQGAMCGNTLVLAGRRTVCLWKNPPLNGEMPDAIFEGRIGNVEFESVGGIALDEKHFYLSTKSEGSGRGMLHVWNGIPGRDSNPRLSIPTEDVGRLHSDGTHLAGILFRQETVGVWEIDGLSESSRPATLPVDKLNPNAPIRFNGPGNAVVRDNHLFVSDVGFGRVMVWNHFKDAVAGKPADIVLGENDLKDIKQEIGRNKLFWPSTLAFDGSFLWVGEVKFSGRILRFSIGK